MLKLALLPHIIPLNASRSDGLIIGSSSLYCLPKLTLGAFAFVRSFLKNRTESHIHVVFLPHNL